MNILTNWRRIVENKGGAGRALEKWIREGNHFMNHSRTASISYKNGRFFIRISHYFEHYKDGLDAKGEAVNLQDAAKDAILHFNQLLWKQITRRSKDPDLNKLKNEEHNLILKEMKKVHDYEFAMFDWLKSPEMREKIYKNYDLLELNKKEENI